MKDKTLAVILALFLGGLGAHKFYLGRSGTGLIYLLFCWTFIPAILGFLEAIVYISMSKEVFDTKYNGTKSVTTNAQKATLKEKVDGTTVAICPACAEEIKPEAIKCKHCGTNIGSNEGSVKQSVVPAKKGLGVGSLLIIIALVGILASVVLSSLNSARDSVGNNTPTTNSAPVAQTSNFDFGTYKVQSEELQYIDPKTVNLWTSYSDRKLQGKVSEGDIVTITQHDDTNNYCYITKADVSGWASCEWFVKVK